MKPSRPLRTVPSSSLMALASRGSSELTDLTMRSEWLPSSSRSPSSASGCTHQLALVLENQTTRTPAHADIVVLQVVLQIFQSQIPSGRRLVLVLPSDRLLSESDGCVHTDRVSSARTGPRRPDAVDSLLLVKEASVAFAAFSLPLPSLSFALCGNGVSGAARLPRCMWPY